jgi:Spy/CpxP family protein refolding chaperone
MKRFIAAVAWLLIGASASVATAQSRGMHEALPGFKTLLRTANLTPEQHAQVHQLMKASWTQRKVIHAQIRALREQIADKLSGTASVSASDFLQLQAQIEQLRGQLQQQSIQAALQVRALLTADQLRQVSQAHEQIKSLRAQMKAVLPQQTTTTPDRFEDPVQ